MPAYSLTYHEKSRPFTSGFESDLISSRFAEIKIDPISDLSDVCLDEKVFLHVDAAFGGYVIPFLKKLGYYSSDFDFKLKGVSSITIDAIVAPKISMGFHF